MSKASTRRSARSGEACDRRVACGLLWPLLPLFWRGGGRVMSPKEPELAPFWLRRSQRSIDSGKHRTRPLGAISGRGGSNLERPNPAGLDLEIWRLHWDEGMEERMMVYLDTLGATGRLKRVRLGRPDFGASLEWRGPWRPRSTSWFMRISCPAGVGPWLLTGSSTRVESSKTQESRVG